MAQSEAVARARAATALRNVTDSGDNHLMHIGQFSTCRSGGSIRVTLGRQFVRFHDTGRKDMMNQFFDPETGALVIVPEGAESDCPSMSGD